MAAPVEELTLICAESNKEYIIIVSSEDAEKARKDMNFATLLLQQAKENQEKQSMEQDLSANDGNTHLWIKEETMLLLQLYSDYSDKFNNGKGTVKQYWNKIATIMQEHGYNVTGFKCSTKFQALKRTYKSVIDHNKKSGNNRKEWEYLKIMQELFGDKPWVQPVAVAGSHLDETEEKENTLPEKRTKRKNLSTFLEEYLSHCKEEKRIRREMLVEKQEEKINSLKRIENLMEKLLENGRK